MYRLIFIYAYLYDYCAFGFYVLPLQAEICNPIARSCDTFLQYPNTIYKLSAPLEILFERCGLLICPEWEVT